jgi:hypothetical protein
MLLVRIVTMIFIIAIASAWTHGSTGGNFLLDDESGYLLTNTGERLTAQ